MMVPTYVEILAYRVHRAVDAGVKLVVYVYRFWEAKTERGSQWSTLPGKQIGL